MVYENVEKSFRTVDRIYFELSHRCPLAEVHKSCPISKMRAEFDGSLDTDVILKVCEDVKKYKSKAGFSFHIYNEPSIDCRLLWIIHHIRQHLKLDNLILIRTSGWGLDENVFNDWIREGVTRLLLDAYDKESYDRMYELKNKLMRDGVRIDLKMLELDDRLKIYEKEPVNRGQWCKDLHIEAFDCLVPINQLNILANGDVILCELDWKYTVKFGNIYKDSYETIFRNKVDCYNEIIKNDCNIGACLRCGYLAGIGCKK